MRVSFVLLLVSLTLLSGCFTISPRCNFTDFTKNEELNKIAISVQVNDVRKDSERYFIVFPIGKVWEEGSTHFNNFQRVYLSEPSGQLLQESLSGAFSEYGYSVAKDSSVIINCELLRFLYGFSLEGNPPIFAEIKTDLSIQKEGQTLVRKSYIKRLQRPFHAFRQYEDSEPVLSECLTVLVKDIVLDREIENALKKVYGIPVPEEPVNIPKVDKMPKLQDSPEVAESPKLQDPHEQVKRDSIIYTGTGFAICEKGYILTAHHVVEKATSIYVKFQDTEWLPAAIIKKSRINDVAILKVDRNTKHFLAISDKLRQGEKIFTLGYPVPGLLGEEPKYAEGTVSSLTGIVDEASLMQISVPLQPGNSGGPLLNEKAEVVGMATSVAGVESFYEATGTLPQNVNWGVKAAFIKPLLPADCVNSELPNEKTEIDPIEIARNAVCLIKTETK